MGIQGLLPLLKPIHRSVNISEFKGQTVGVDAYCWLHKGAYGCAMDLVEGKKTTVYINYVLKRINMMLFHDVKPVLVFDGAYLPSKANKEAERRKSRNENKANGLAFLRAGNRAKAQECFQKCVDISPDMALEVIKMCRSKGVDCIVAPYEADAQLAYLMKKNIIQAVISEDSDLLVYGCKKVMFKMDASGHGTLVSLDHLSELTNLKMHEFTLEKFRHMCILSGCDYLPSIKGIGLIKANKLLRNSSNINKLVRNLRMDDQYRVPVDYEQSFKQADETFLYQRVFDPVSCELVPLNPIPEGMSHDHNLHFAGPAMPRDKALGIALGNIHPISGEVIGDFDPAFTKILTERSEKPEPSAKPGCAFTFNNHKEDLTPRSTSWEKSSFRHGAAAKRSLQDKMVPALPSMKRSDEDNEENSMDEQAFVNMYTSIKAREDMASSGVRGVANKTRSQSGLGKLRRKNPFRSDSGTGGAKLSRYFVKVSAEATNDNLSDESSDSLSNQGQPGALLGSLAANKENRHLLFVESVNGSSPPNSQSVNHRRSHDSSDCETQDCKEEEMASQSSSPSSTQNTVYQISEISRSESSDSSEPTSTRVKVLAQCNSIREKTNAAETLNKTRDGLKRFLYQAGSKRTFNQPKMERTLDHKESEAETPSRGGVASDVFTRPEVIEIDSGYLSDGEESAGTDTPPPSQGSGSSQQGMPGRLIQSGSSAGLKTMKKQIQVKPKPSGHVSGLGRCRAMGMRRKTEKPGPESGSQSILSHFEYTKNKKPRLESSR